MIRIGHSHRSRQWQTYAFEHPPERMQYFRALDVPFYRLGTSSQFLLHTKWFVPGQGADLYHTYNGIVANHKPWIIEVEYNLPRYTNMPESDPRFQWGIQRLRSEDCRKILFVSAYAAENNRANFARWGIPWDKTEVFYRAVPRYEPVARPDEELHVLFAGNAFFRKGGVELLQAFRALPDPHLRLIIISNFEQDYRVIPSEADRAWAQQQIAADARISVYSNLPQAQVIEHMRRADLFVAPTYHDAFNNTILEAMSCGLPVITSDVVSIPEFVSHEENGFMLPVSLKREQEQIVADLKRYLQTMVAQPELRRKMGAASHRICRERFSIEVRNQALSRILKQALAPQPV
jgi:glycosyltransferase involved in cell wall biosynthesis